MHTDARAWEDDGEPPTDPSWASQTVDGAWLRTANPNSVDGELQNIAAFSAGVIRLRGWRRTAVRIVVWLILVGFGVLIVVGAVTAGSNLVN